MIVGLLIMERSLTLSWPDFTLNTFPNENHTPCINFRVKRHIIFYFRVNQNKLPMQFSVAMKTTSFSQLCEELRAGGASLLAERI